MAIRLRNSWKYSGEDRWDWEAFLDDGGSGELSNIAYVEWVLHPTFPKPVRTVSEPEGGFALKTNGWGTFELKAFAYTKDGRKLKLTHPLQLRYEPLQGTTA